MSVNRYTNVNWNQPVSLFVPRPFEALNEVGRQTQHRYDEGKALKDQSLGVLDDIKAASFDQPAKKELVQKYNQGINDLVDKYKYNYGSTEFKNELSQFMNKAKSDTEFQRLAHNKKFEDDVLIPYRKDKANAGNINHFELDPNLQNNTDKKWMTDIPNTQYADAREYYGKVFDKIKEQSISLTAAQANSKAMGEGYYFIDQDGQHKYTHPDQINSITEANFPGFLNSKEGAYEFHKHLKDIGASQLLSSQGYDVSKLTPQNSKDILDKIPMEDGSKASDYINKSMKQNMNAYGQQFIHDQYDTKLHRTQDFVANHRQLEADKEAKIKNNLSLNIQTLPTDPNDVNSKESLQNIVTSQVGSNFKVDETGKISWNPNQDRNSGTKDGDLINVNGKNVTKSELLKAPVMIDGKEYKADPGSFNRPDEKKGIVNQVKLVADDGSYKLFDDIRPKNSKSIDSIKEDTQKMIDITNRMGLHLTKMDDMVGAYNNYINDFHNITPYSTGFNKGIKNWLSKEYGTETKTNADGEQVIVNPGEMSNMTIKTPNGDPIMSDNIQAEKAAILNGARFSGFSKTLTNDKIKAGDMEITGGDGKRYIVSSGSHALENSAQKSHNLLTSFNNYITKGETQYNSSQTKTNEENKIKSELKLPKSSLIHATSTQVDSQGNKFTSILVSTPSQSGYKVLPKVVILNKEGKMVDVITPQEASRMLDEDGLKQNINLYDPKEMDRVGKDTHNNEQMVEDDSDVQ